MKTFRNFVNGSFVDAKSGETTNVINPATGQVYAQAVLSREADVDLAMRAAEHGAELWRDATPGERSLALYRMADAVESRAEELIALEVENTGKPIAITRSEEIPPMVDQMRFFAGAARNLEGKSAGEYMRGMTSFIRREPVGVCAQVAPWNYPMMMAVWKFAPALAAGNSIVLKPSDTTPATTTLLAEIAAEFFPPGVFNVICGDRDTGRAMVTHNTPSMVSVTGSVRAGIEVAQAAATSLKRVHLELGGKAPVVVFDDADIDSAVEGAMASKYRNAGQTCVCANRIYVQESVYDTFVQKFAAKVKALKVGNGFEDGVVQGPLIEPAALEKVTRHVEDAKAKGGVVLAGGKALNGQFFEPTVIGNATADMLCAKEETFGPFAPVFKFKTEQEAIDAANNTEFGLASYFYSRDVGRIFRVSEGLEYGMVGINVGVIATEHVPFGGVKQSGLGREGSHHGMDEYLEMKYLCMGDILK